MNFYIIDTHSGEKAGEYEERARANYVLTNSYGPNPGSRHVVMDNIEYDFFLRGFNRGIRYARGIYSQTREEPLISQEEMK